MPSGALTYMRRLKRPERLSLTTDLIDLGGNKEFSFYVYIANGRQEAGESLSVLVDWFTVVDGKDGKFDLPIAVEESTPMAFCLGANVLAAHAAMKLGLTNFDTVANSNYCKITVEASNFTASGRDGPRRF